MSEEITDVSYCVGMSLGGSLMQQNLNELNVSAMAEAIQDAFAGKQARFSVEEANQIIQGYLKVKGEKEFAQFKTDGEAFLAANGERPEVNTTASGLQYEILEEGAGEKPTLENSVTVHYHGTLTDGTVFDSSVERGNPATFGVGQVIAGWTEALQLMPKGAKYKLYIPQELAYGASPHPGGAIKPFMALIFEVELIEITK
ncbi:MAG: peptidylprolyl isomerase [Bacteroidetes bacterium RIFCSPHIGHO2_02_FULL_44_7]|nr:MAG: peptidylprolyl isomerase [Bacteroidetes bacterium RIFCSPHIGHO2_02_FULL_44_7]